MSTDTPLPDDENRPHTEEPAEGEAPGAAGDEHDERRHSEDPAEGKDVAGA
jgi:hypothetical protein